MDENVERLLALCYLCQSLLRKRIRIEAARSDRPFVAPLENQAVALITGKNVVSANKASIINFLFVKLPF